MLMSQTKEYAIKYCDFKARNFCDYPLQVPKTRATPPCTPL
jgi:hypothetical protein